MPLGASKLNFLAKVQEVAAEASWADWTTANINPTRYEPSVADNIAAYRTAHIFNCGDDDNIYFIGTDNSDRYKHYIFRYSRSGENLTYQNRVGPFTSVANIGLFNSSAVLDLPEFNKAIVLHQHIWLVVVTQNTSTKAVSFGTEQTSLNTVSLGNETAWVVNPDDNTEFAGIGSAGTVIFASFNNSTDAVSVVTSDTLPAEVEHSLAIFDDNGTKKVAVSVWDGTDIIVYTYNFDGTGKTTTNLGSSFSGFNQSSFHASGVADPTMLMMNDNNTNIDDAVGLYWTGSAWAAGTPTSFSIPGDSAGGVNNVRGIRVFEPLGEDGYKGVTLHMDTSGSVPRQNFFGVFYVNPSNGSVTQIDDWVAISQQASLNNIFIDMVPTSTGDYVYVMSLDDDTTVKVNVVSKE